MNSQYCCKVTKYKKRFNMFPFEIITFLVSNIMGGLISGWKLKTKANMRLEEAKLAALNARAKVAKEIREHDDKGFKITRRFIAISACFAILILPSISPLISMFAYLYAEFPYPIIPVTFGYTQLDPGLWPFTSDVNITKWYENYTGFLITPWHTHLISAIWGYYFGSSDGK